VNDSRTFVIGDIHGAYRALQQVIQRVAPQPEDRLIFLGDYVDGWSESRRVMEYLMELDGSHNCIFMRGNHDAWCEEWLAGMGPDPGWLFHGGRATLESYAGIGPADTIRHLAFFSRMRSYYEEDGRLFIHAGFSSLHGPAMEHYESNYFWDRTLWEMALAVDGRIPQESLLYPRRLKLYREIYIGHTPTTNYDRDTPMQACNVWNIDTGAAFTGRLSMMDIATKAVIQSDTVQRLYPGEPGRNK
jgi:serine/threonine protein phosphatase 1